MTLAVLIVLLLTSVSYAEDLTNVQWLNCHDGDTCHFNVLLPAIFGTNIGVRFSGIDTPEIRGRCAKETLMAKAARDFLTAHMKASKKIEIKEVFRDKYFRVQGILLADGVNLNNLMVSKGFAVPYSGTGPRHNWCAA